MGLNTQNLAGIIIVVFLTWLNVFGIKTGAAVQNVFTIAKVSALAALVLAGIFVARNAQAVAANFGDFWRLGLPHSAGGADSAGHLLGPFVGVLTILAVAQVGSLFSADAWNNVTFTAGEVKDPKRNLPLSLAIGTGVVILLYIAANFIYLAHLPFDGNPAGADVVARGIKYAASDRVGTAVLQQMFGSSGAGLMAIAILISTFRLLQWPDPERRSRLLRHGQRWTVLQIDGESPSQISDAEKCVDRAGHLDLRAVSFRHV